MRDDADVARKLLETAQGPVTPSQWKQAAVDAREELARRDKLAVVRSLAGEIERVAKLDACSAWSLVEVRKVLAKLQEIVK